MNKGGGRTGHEEWSMIIKPKSGWFELHLNELWRYRDLIFLFVKRDFVAMYKQTILGPMWFLIQPVLTTLTFTLIFNRVAKLSTDGIPPMVFYMSGLILWNYFAACLTKSSNTFITNASIFGKVYFPRLVVPIADLFTNMISLGIQFGLFVAFAIFYYFSGYNISPNMYVLLIPVLIIIIAGMGLGFGVIISSLTTKYRDLTFLVTFGVQLFMYATPVIYPMSLIPDKQLSFLSIFTVSYKSLLWYNPISAIIETFRYALLGSGSFEWLHLGYSFTFMVIILFIGILLFNRVEKNFMDVI